ncbi:MAG: Fic family protein [Victivallales bacterium]|nr:Fic family protein [Victivallales bacterium]
MERLGYSHLIERFSLTVLEQHTQCFLDMGTVLFRELTPEGMEVHYPQRFRTDGSWQEHLLFAIKHEGVNLEVLRALFQRLEPQEMAALVTASPHSVYVRRLWFLYEYLMGHELPVSPLKTGNYGYVLPPDEYFCLDRMHSWKAKRQRLFCNLPGNALFCPVVRLTPRIKECLQKDLASRVKEAISGYPVELLYRASDFLYLKETKSSYAIERQTPSQKRTAAFMGVLREAGKGSLTKPLLLRLQNAIVDERYAEKDYRDDQVYVGQTLAPGRELVHFVGLKPCDLKQFMEAYLETAGKLVGSSCDAVICAAVLSFAFVFIHPFDDGNGRLHRYLMHYVLNAMGFCPENVIFPVSALLYKNAKLYDGMLESFSRRLLPLVEYRLAADGSMTVENDTVDFYRHIDFTRIVEDFFDAVEQTLKNELLPELDYLARWEKARSLMREIVDMPDKKVAQFILFTQQNNGIFPKARRMMFQELADEEIAALAKVVKDVLMPVVEQK